MKNLFRGGALTLLLSLFVVIIYAQTRTEATLTTIGSDPQSKFESNIVNHLDNTLSNKNTNANAANANIDTKITDTKNDKKLVKATALVKSTSMGASRGSFSATAYCFAGRTAMGHAVRRGLIAADPRVLKLGSTVYINAGPWTGTYLVSDTGGGVKGKRVDIWVPNCSEARRFGRRSVEVFSVQ
jgi:3D (Asp-Asp-Asp) domain-containing protein